MKNKSLLIIGLGVILSLQVIAQESEDAAKKSTKASSAKRKAADASVDTTVAGEDGPAGKGKWKDLQNQTQFFDADMQSEKHNFYRRKEVSVPLQPSYDRDSAVYQKGGKRERQQRSYRSSQYLFPARPRDAWELGVNFGSAFISGDVKSYVNIKGLTQNVGVGFHVRKALGYIFSLRMGYNYMVTTGRNWEPDQNLEFNTALRGVYDRNVNYWDSPRLLRENTQMDMDMRTMFFYNYRTYIHDAHLVAIANLGNIKYHRERTILNVYALAGVSATMFTTYMDALNENGDVYDFSKPFDLYVNGNNNNNVNTRIVNQRKEALRLLDQIYDGKYESFAEKENNVPGLKNWQFIPAFTLGGGVQFHATKFMTVGIEQRVILTGSDLLDGYRWQQDQWNGLSRDNDNLSYTSVSLNFHLGLKKRTEPLYWLNPNYHQYKKMGEVDPAKLAEDILKDDDEDGVPNRLDMEPNTPKNCPVDTKGRSLDSDKDGVKDCLDKEPYSQPGYPVDNNGVAIMPPNPCCDTGDGSGSFNGMGPNSGKGRRGNPGYDCSKIELPAIVFDADKYYIDPQYYGNLHQVAERIQMCPDVKLVVSGFDESRNDQKYNEQLAWNRANATIDYLVEKYGVSRDRFIVKYQGGKKAATGTPYERKMKNKTEFRYANDGEAGESNPPAPHPGLKAGSNK